MDVWDRLRAALGRFGEESLTTPEGGRIGAALALLHDAGGGELHLVLTRRRDDLPHHPGQISFPGGRVEPGETVEQAAIREAQEEVGLDPASVEVIGRLPAFYIPPSRFWLQTVVARWSAPHPLAAAELEVAEILQPPLSMLRDRASWRVVRLSSAAHTWAWQLDERHLLWGATAIATSALLGLLDPDWHGGTDPASLPPELEVRPWDHPDRAVPRRGAARIPGVPEVSIEAVEPVAAPLPAPQTGDAQAAGALIAAAVRRVRRPGGPGGGVLVLIGSGGKGLAGACAAAVLAREGIPVRAVLSRPLEALAAPIHQVLLESQVDAGPFDGALPAAETVVDALVGSGLQGSLKGEPLRIFHALRHLPVPLVTLDLPSGLDPVRGLVGECVTADVTIALQAPRAGVLQTGLAPFVGDLYLAPETAADAEDGDDGDGFGDAPLVRLVAADEGGWRE